ADLGARTMVPIHYDTLVNGFDARGEARMLLESYVHARGLDDRVKVLPIGGQGVIAAETAPAPETPRVVAIEASCDIILPGPFRFRAGSSELGTDSAFLVDSYTSLIRTSCLKPER